MTQEVRDRIKTNVATGEAGEWDAAVLWQHMEAVEQENADLNSLFELQWTRMAEATKLWREATGRHDVSPDLGDLLKWLMDRIAELEKAVA